VWTNTDVAGAFRCAGLAPGRVTVEISDRGYEPVTLVVFVSGPYSTVGADADPVSVALSPALPTSNGSASVLVNETVFGDLESFVASAWSGASLLALGALVSGYSSGLAAQERRPAFVAAGGASALLAPVPLFLLGVTTAFPLTGPFAIAIAGVGVAVASLQIGRSLSIGAPANPD
ncbi:MAG TPA: hypothetical protein VLY85_03600, partial [Thermoplasmata archaeon]|nr:hypothetical protein [Thermoplasmata archaeon]